jgi:hypothetical protein
MITMAKRLFYTVCFLAAIAGSNAKAVKSNDSLYRKIAQLDSMVFNAFNNRDTATFNRFFAKDLEFYHDKGGLTGYQTTADFAKAQADNKTDLKRTLVPGSLEVFRFPIMALLRSDHTNSLIRKMVKPLAAHSNLYTYGRT